MSARDWGRGDTRRLTVHQFPRAVLELVYDAQGHHPCEDCHALGLTPPPDEPLELDHKQPISLGGDNHWSNLRRLCRSHNRGRGARAGAPKEPAWLRRAQ